MTNWKKFKITGKETVENFNLINFKLDSDVPSTFKGIWMLHRFIFCVNRYPFNTCQVGDYLEIDVEKTVNYESGHKFDDINIVRKFGSSAVVPSSSSNQQMTMEQFQAIGNQMMDRAERSGGEYETAYTAQEEYRADGSFIRQIGWTYRKSK